MPACMADARSLRIERQALCHIGRVICGLTCRLAGWQWPGCWGCACIPVLGSAMQLLHRCSEIYCWEEAVVTLNHYIWAQSVILAMTGAMPLELSEVSEVAIASYVTRTVTSNARRHTG